MKKFEEQISYALNEGGGIAVIGCLIECPSCNNDIWINGGHHCGFDAVLEGLVHTKCYKCSNFIKADVSNISTIKDMKFMTTNKFVEHRLK
jgi:hypothetical protein